MGPGCGGTYTCLSCTRIGLTGIGTIGVGASRETTMRRGVKTYLNADMRQLHNYYKIAFPSTCDPRKQRKIFIARTLLNSNFGIRYQHNSKFETTENLLSMFQFVQSDNSGILTNILERIVGNANSF